MATVNQATICSELSARKWHETKSADQEEAGESPHTLHEGRPANSKDNRQSSPSDYIQRIKQRRENSNGGNRERGRREAVSWQERLEPTLQETKTPSPETSLVTFHGGKDYQDAADNSGKPSGMVYPRQRGEPSRHSSSIGRLTCENRFDPRSRDHEATSGRNKRTPDWLQASESEQSQDSVVCLSSEDDINDKKDPNLLDAGETMVWNDDWKEGNREFSDCLLYTSPSPRDGLLSRMPSSA